ncbi:hypothetical protein ACOSP7_010475 [Xanthoceras sorbifolium]|uniref:RRM domain-containing protein n=1 Tax=Xanthoceras sorbifolium TaxID=99658 RepID=A0ABQ8HTB6_9ROSI|nr:hypothetical protein JRO89_XS07G0093200 [Xanthoceras sorbifolium]
MDTDQSKLFVGGISRETSEETLRDHFSNYGSVLGSAIARERNTKTPRGFGFVWFSDPSSADKALKVTHVILGRTVEVKKAIPRSEQHQNQQKQQLQHCPNESQNSRSSKNSSNVDINNNIRTKKIFVGGLSSNLTEEEFKNYFKTFGMITDVVVMHDNMTNRPRGFGFVTFDSEESVEKVMLKTFHELNGRLVEVKRAVPKEEINGGGTCNYNSRGGVGKGSYNCYQPGNYPPYSPGYGYPPVYAIPGYSGVGGYTPGAGIFGAGYPMVPYGKFGYGITSIAPRSPWYGPVMIGAGAYPLPYGNASVFPAYMNGGALGYNEIVSGGVDGKLGQVLGGSGHSLPNATPSQTEEVKLNVDSEGLKGSNDNASSEQNQKDLDGRFKPLPVGISG